MNFYESSHSLLHRKSPLSVNNSITQIISPVHIYEKHIHQAEMISIELLSGVQDVTKKKRKVLKSTSVNFNFADKFVIRARPVIQRPVFFVAMTDSLSESILA